MWPVAAVVVVVAAAAAAAGLLEMQIPDLPPDLLSQALQVNEPHQVVRGHPKV